MLKIIEKKCNFTEKCNIPVKFNIGIIIYFMTLLQSVDR